ncbi:MAG TPA: hypothetical protein VE172_17355 [Stackebrandtia sp.]|jgi:drug/metabolite transporter superfamily protein YnfA|uniref:hypothetical protein n=1 Tax=Stackebrandtia sp. TaxID=2023065 RepID=UPI002D3B13BA|nr:hypothetical protein [Stackebrandtia sp.]HZE40572.1 hypothetical protein [Stackebrandtia sp.]
MNMKSLWFIVPGVLLAGFGTVFTLQGLGYVTGSPMTSVTLWAIVGPIIALIGLALIVVGGRRLRAK